MSDKPLVLFDLSPFAGKASTTDAIANAPHLSPVEQTACSQFAHGGGGRDVHAAYLEAKGKQGRPVDPALCNWLELPDQDASLDRTIAYAIASSFLEWCKDANTPITIPTMQLSLFPLDAYNTPNPDPDVDQRETAACWVEERGAIASHEAWVLGMISQDRYIKPELKHWAELPERDRQLFAHVAMKVVCAFYEWINNFGCSHARGSAPK